MGLFGDDDDDDEGGLFGSSTKPEASGLFAPAPKGQASGGNLFADDEEDSLFGAPNAGGDLLSQLLAPADTAADPFEIPPPPPPEPLAVAAFGPGCCPMSMPV